MKITVLHKILSSWKKENTHCMHLEASLSIALEESLHKAPGIFVSIYFSNLNFMTLFFSGLFAFLII